MNERMVLLGCMGWLTVVACSGAAPAGLGGGARAAAPVTRIQAREPAAPGAAATASAAPEYQDENQRDRVFVENAERAIGQYTEFIARAGESPEFAPAVKRSREQIEDLRKAIVFVRGGAEERAAY